MELVIKESGEKWYGIGKRMNESLKQIHNEFPKRNTINRQASLGDISSD